MEAEQASDTAPSDWLEVVYPRPPHCVMIIIISAAKPVTAAAAAAGSLSLSVSLSLLSHCQRCGGPCVELELSLSMECYTRGDTSDIVTSGSLGQRTTWQEHRRIN